MPPNDSAEAMYLVLGHLQDMGLPQTYQTMLAELRMPAGPGYKLAKHVSLLRILLDWKRAFEARFHGTPRIIEPIEVRGSRDGNLLQLPSRPTRAVREPAWTCFLW
jgi:hypothetical protein